MVFQRLAIIFLVSLAPCPGPSLGADKTPKPATSPRPELTPGEVVEIQLEALQYNDRPIKDAGIATTFRFASPGNRKVTGPIARFAQIVRGEGYLPLIDHRIAGYGPTLIQGDLAVRQVTIVAANGQGLDYEFRLSRDPEDKCWFTDGVVPIPPKGGVDPGKIALTTHLSAIR